MVTRNRLGPQALDGPAVAVYSPAPATGDPRTPAAPSVLSASPPPAVYQTRGGGYAAAAYLHWTPSTTDVDGNLMGSNFIEVWGAKQATTPKWALLTNTAGDDTDCQLEGFVPTTVWLFKVRAASAQGKVSAYSNTITVTMPKNDPPPLPPSVPTFTTRLGTITITWDGKASGGGAMPADTDHVRVERHSSSTFLPATGMKLVDTILPPGGIAVDAPLTVGDSWFYRLIAVDKAGQDSQPSTVPAAIKVDGITAPDIPPLLISPTMLSNQVALSISDAADAAGKAQTAAQNAAKIFSQGTMPTTGMKLKDLWFDTSAGNLPYRYDIPVGGTQPSWITVRDATLSAAFPPGGFLASDFLDKAVIRSKFLQVGLVDADSIISKGSITGLSACIGEIDASKITFGTMDGQYIRAGTVTASSIFLGDTENLVDAPQFSTDPAWSNAPSAKVGQSLGIADAPTAGAGRVWQITGAAKQQTAWNSRKVAVAPGDSFYAECWVRKTAAATSGTVQLVMLVRRKGTQDTSVLLADNVFKATDPANSWVKINTINTTGTAPNVVTTTGIKVPDLGYEINVALRVQSDVINGNIQFSDVVLRRQNSGRLIVDGSITADQIRGNTITAAQIGAHAITASEIDAAHIRVDTFAAGSLTANSGVIGSLDASKITTGYMSAARITSKSINTLQLNAGHIAGSVIQANTLNADRIVTGTITSGKIGTGQIYAINIHSSQITSGMINGRQIKATNIVSGTISANELGVNSVIASKIKAGEVKAGKLAVNAVVAGNIAAGQVTGTKIAGTAIDGKVITGATIRTAKSGRRVQIDNSGLHLYGSTGTALIALGATSTSFYIRSAASGSHFILDNSGLRLYSGSTNTVNLSSGGSAKIKGTLTAGSIVQSSTVSGAISGSINGTLSGGHVSGSIHSGGGFYGSMDGVGSTIFGSKLQSSQGRNRVEIANDKISFYSQGALGGTIAGDIVTSGLNITPAGFGKSIFVGAQHEIQVSGGRFWSQAVYNNTSTAGANVTISASGYMTRHTSSARYKQKVRDLKLAAEYMKIRTATWMDKPSAASIDHRITSYGNPRFTGFIAENLHEIGLSDAVVYDKMARPDTISVPSLLAHTVRYVQNLVNRVDELSERVAAMEGAQ